MQANEEVVHDLEAGHEVVVMDGFRSIGVWFDWCAACRAATSRG